MKNIREYASGKPSICMQMSGDEEEIRGNSNFQLLLDNFDRSICYRNDQI